jgi:YgiT-type zinc finger domain-containing protein
MICLICRQAEIIDGLAPVAFERGEFRLIVNSVPSRLCPTCGEAFLEEDVAQRLLSFAVQQFETGLFEIQCEYSTLQI